MSKRTVEQKLVRRNAEEIKALTDVLCNAKTKMVTIDFRKKDGSERTINGMIGKGSGLAFNPFERGLVPVVENIIIRNRLGQCKTICTQPRLVNLTTVSRIAFNNKVYNFI